MTGIKVTFMPWDDRADDDDDTGLTAEAYTELMGVLATFGYEVEIERSR